MIPHGLRGLAIRSLSAHLSGSVFSSAKLRSAWYCSANEGEGTPRRVARGQFRLLNSLL